MKSTTTTTKPARSTASYQFAAQVFGLTKKQVEVVGLVMTGKRDKEVADLLGVTVPAIRRRLESVFRKTGVSSKWELFFKLEAVRGKAGRNDMSEKQR